MFDNFLSQAKGLFSLLVLLLMKFRYRKALVVGGYVKVDFNTSIKISKYSTVVLGDGVFLRSNSCGYHAGMPYPTGILVDGECGNVSIGARSRLNGVYVHAKESIVIGEGCVIASGVNILDSNGHELLSMNRVVDCDIPQPVKIGRNVWIGVNAVILKGSSLGDNCVVGANSVVRGCFEKNSLIIGNPARLVKLLDIQ